VNLALTVQLEQIGELECRVVDTARSAEQPEKIVIICHGFGAPGDDLVPCSREIYAAGGDELEKVRFVFPVAPLSLDDGLGDSRAWWPIDMMALQIAIESGNIRDLRNDQPELLPSRRSEMLGVIEELKTQTGLAENDFVLGGFSQGSMIATDVALSMTNPPGGLIIWSGTLLNEPNWTEWATNRDEAKRFPIFQSHGRTDPILPFCGAEWLREMLDLAHFQVDFMPFSGQHTIPMEGITSAAKLIAVG